MLIKSRQQKMQDTNPLSNAPRVSRATTLGADSAGDGVLLQL